MTWIRFELYQRYHAVYEAGRGEYLTYCGRHRDVDHVRAKTEEPPARCACCVGRIKHPYLIPGKMKRRARVAGE